MKETSKTISRSRQSGVEEVLFKQKVCEALNAGSSPVFLAILTDANVVQLVELHLPKVVVVSSSLIIRSVCGFGRTA